MLLWISTNSLCHLSHHKSFFLQSLHRSSVWWSVTPLYFFSSSIIYFGQKKPIKVQLLRLSSIGSKLVKLLMSFFKVQVSSYSSFALFFCVMTHNPSVLFLAQAEYSFDKISKSKCKFSNFLLLALKFTKFLMSFLEPRVIFSSNFVSLFSIMETITVKIYILLTTRVKKKKNSLCHFSSHESIFL